MKIEQELLLEYLLSSQTSDNHTIYLLHWILNSGCIKYCLYKSLNIQPKSVTFSAARVLEFDF